MNIQWYPGHMTKARRKIESDIKLVDLVIELLDARCPLATRNPDIQKIAKGKQRLVLLNKADLADESVTAAWADCFKGSGIMAIPLDSRGRDSADRVRKAASGLMQEKRERDRARGIVGERAVKALICGIPNVGKSTFINSMAGKASAKTGNRPGVTKGNQWININNEILMLDTPGVLWPKFDDEETAVCLAEIGAINDDIINLEELSIRLLDYLNLNYRDKLMNRFEITKEALAAEMDKIDDGILGVNREALAVFNIIAVKRGCLKKGAEADYARCSRLLIDEFRSGRIGRISLQRP